MAAISFERKLYLVKLKDSEDLSFRQASARTGIPKSTIHDNLGKFRDEIDSFNRAVGENPSERLVRAVLILSMSGKCSTRDIGSILHGIWGVNISHQTIMSILSLAADIAERFNKQLDLSSISSALFDEVFQNRSSTSTYLSLIFIVAATPSMIIIVVVVLMVLLIMIAGFFAMFLLPHLNFVAK